MTRTKWLVSALVGVLAVAVVAVLVVVSTQSIPADDSSGRSPSSEATADSNREFSGDCENPDVTVTSGTELQAALDKAEPGMTISMASAVFYGNFTASISGTEDAPITLCGARDSVLDGGGTRKGYVLHLDGVSHWRVYGFSVRNGQKGVMADAVSNSEIRGLSVSTIGDEAIHLRKFSTDNIVEGNDISDTGLRKPKFGEGIYIGTAESNWCSISDCEPDRSDRNVVENNTISRTTSEAIDIKEGTSDGILRGNHFDGSHIAAADSWVDVKGNDWLIDGNEGFNSPEDGFQVHEILDGWGTGNTFVRNTANVNGPGFGFAITPVLDNVVDCTNTVSEAGEGLSNADCTA